MPSRVGAVRVAALACAGALSLGSSACASLTTVNVRAMRAYANEDAEADVVRDRADDLSHALSAIDRLLAGTPYSPGDAWVSELRLDDAHAKAIRQRVTSAGAYADGAHEVPIVKLYREHLEPVLAKAGGPRAEAARYASLLDAADGLGAGTSLSAWWAALAKAEGVLVAALTHEARVRAEVEPKRALGAPDPPALVAAHAEVARAEADTRDARDALVASAAALASVDVSDPARRAVARDVLEGVSVAERLSLEVLALVPTVSVQASRVAESESRTIFGSGDVDRAITELPVRADAIERRAKAEQAVLDPLLASLERATGVDRTRTAGYALSESVVDQIVGITLDSVGVHAKLGSELFFFHELGTLSATSEKERATESYAGRTRRLAYHVKPIAVVGGRLLAAFDWLHLKNAVTVNAGFKTDRLWSSNGSLERSASLGDQLGLHGFTSDVFDIGMDLLGVSTSYVNARFDSGTVEEIAVDPKSGADVASLRTAPLVLRYEQLDVGYDVAFLMPETAGKLWLEQFVLGFRYQSYQLPRILYELSDVSAPGDDTQLVFQRESPAQTVRSRHYMGGFTARFGQGEARTLSLFADLGLYGGAGPVAYYFLRSPTAPDAVGNREMHAPTALVYDAAASLGLRLRITPKRARLRVACELAYHGEAIGQTIVTEIRETQTKDGTSYSVGKEVTFGGTDLFHGPRLSVVGAF